MQTFVLKEQVVIYRLDSTSDVNKSMGIRVRRTRKEVSPFLNTDNGPYNFSTQVKVKQPLRLLQYFDYAGSAGLHIINNVVFLYKRMHVHNLLLPP